MRSRNDLRHALGRPLATPTFYRVGSDSTVGGVAADLADDKTCAALRFTRAYKKPDKYHEMTPEMFPRLRKQPLDFPSATQLIPVNWRGEAIKAEARISYTTSSHLNRLKVGDDRSNTHTHTHTHTHPPPLSLSLSLPLSPSLFLLL